MKATFETEPTCFFRISIDGIFIGVARDQAAAEQVVAEYVDAVRDAAQPLANALRALWRSYDGPTRARFASN
jgi:hypothetical protein